MSHAKTAIAIKGGYGFGNFGDDALMLAAHEIVKLVFDSENLIFICNDADYIQRIIPGAEVVSLNSREAGNVDVIVFGGGTQFYSFPLTSRKGVRHLFSRILRNAKRPVRLGQKLFRKMTETSHLPSNARAAAIGIGIGPFVENCSRERWTKKLFMRMDYVALRDIHSYLLCKQWKCKNISLCSDLCYLPNLWQAHASQLRTDDETSKIKKIGIITRDWPHTREGDSYAGPLFQVVDKLRSAGKEVEFISLAKSSDKVWAKRLENQHENPIAWNPEQCSVAKFIELLSGYDAFITARYHGAVFASILGKPVVCIEVEQKMRLVSELFEDGARLWPYPFSASECVEQISDIEDRYSKSVECLASVVKKQNALAEKMVSEFQAYTQRLGYGDANGKVGAAKR